MKNEFNLQVKTIEKNNEYVINSKIIEIESNQQFRVVTNIIAKVGLGFSFYFCVIILDSEKKEINRFVRYVNEFSNEQKPYEIIFNNSNEGKYAIIGYRANKETPVSSYIEIEFTELTSLKLKKTLDKVKEKFDDINNLIIPKLKSLSEEEEDILEEKITWIFGSPRTGTTWLGTQLLKHPQTITWHEPYIGWLLEKQKAAWYTTNKQYFFSIHHKNNWLPSLRKLILARTYSLAQTTTKEIIIKEPNGSGAADIIMECFPKSKLIFLLRDGRDVVDSLMDVHKANSWGRETMNLKLEELESQQKRLDTIKRYANSWKQWTEIVWNTFQSHDPDNRLLVRYEDLVNDTFTNLKNIYQFLKIDITDNELKEIIERHSFKNIPEKQKGSGKFYRAATPGKWKESFNTKEIELVNSILSKTLKKMKYE